MSLIFQIILLLCVIQSEPRLAELYRENGSNYNDYAIWRAAPQQEKLNMNTAYHGTQYKNSLWPVEYTFPERQQRGF